MSFGSGEANPNNLQSLVLLRDVCCTVGGEAGGNEQEEAPEIASTSTSAASSSSSELVREQIKESPEVPHRCRPYVKLSREKSIKPGWLEVISRLAKEAPNCLGDKPLTTTDLSKQQNRFKFTKGMEVRLLKMLKEEEQKVVHGENGLKVKVYDRMGRSYVLDLKFWDSNSWYALKGKDYMKFIKDNDLHVNVELSAWAFRTNDRRLCLALVS